MCCTQRGYLGWELFQHKNEIKNHTIHLEKSEPHKHLLSTANTNFPLFSDRAISFLCQFQFSLISVLPGLREHAKILCKKLFLFQLNWEPEIQNISRDSSLSIAVMKYLACSDQILDKNVNYDYPNALQSLSLQAKSTVTNRRVTFYTLKESESAVVTPEHCSADLALHPGVRPQWFLVHYLTKRIWYNFKQSLHFAQFSEQ